MSAELERRWELERWISLVRLIAVPWALIEVGLITNFTSERYETTAWVVTGVLAAGAIVFFWVGRRGVPSRYQPGVCLAGLMFDTAVIWAYALVFSFESGSPTIRALLFFPVLEAALRYGMRGGLLLPVSQVPMLVAIEWWRSDHFTPSDFRLQSVTVPFGLQLAVGAVVGWLVNRLAQETTVAHERATEAEGLRDQLGRRVDLLDATNRCARALGSSLEIEEAFAAFIRELRGVIPFDRTAIVLADEGSAQRRWRELTPEQRESFLALIDHETNRLADLVADVLDTSKIESGQFSYRFTDVDVGELVQESAAAAESGQDEIEIRSQVHGPLPLVRGDRDRLRQVLTNLLDNAVKYSPAGEAVEVEALAENGRISVEVRDSGPGVAPEHHALIFEKFGRVTGEHAKPGTGLGLFIARSIAQAHGGSLEGRPRHDLRAPAACG